MQELEAQVSTFKVVLTVILAILKDGAQQG